jgi:ATP-dependent RNA helicase DDX21
VIQFDPPRDVDTYVHRSGRTGRAGKSGTSVLLFSRQQARDIVRIERDLGHGFKFELAGPPSIEAAMRAAAKTSADACRGISDDAVGYFRGAAAELLEESDDPEEIVARCLAAISRRSTDIQSRSLITGELGFASVEMSYSTDKKVTPGDVMFTVGKLARQSSGDMKFDSDVGKIQTQADEGTAIFDLGVSIKRALNEG